MAVTIRDVARVAGVSASTVSRALSSPEVVDPSTRERILRAADHLGWRPNRVARGLITGRTGALGLVVPDLANPFFPGLVKGVQQRARAADHHVFMADTDEDPAAELDLVRSLGKQVDGVVLASPRMRTRELREAVSLGPTVLVNRELPGAASVAFDDAGGTALAVDHLAGLGHRDVGWVGGPHGSWSDGERLKGLERSCAAAGVRLVRLGHFAPTFDGGLAAVDGVLLAGVTAVVAYNDLVALGLCRGLHERGVDVPDALSVVGVDDVPAAAMVSPALTTVAIPTGDAGRTAVDVLLGLLAAPPATPPRIRLSTRLLVRGTTAAAPARPPGPPGRTGPRAAPGPRRRIR